MFRGIIVRVIVLVALPICFLTPFNGLLWYLWYSHGRPNDFIWPEYAFEEGAYLLAVTTLVGYFIFEYRFSPLRFRGLIVVTLFWAWIALATLFAVNRDIAFPRLHQYTNILIITYLTAALANSASRIRALLYVIASSIGLLGAKAGYDFIITGGRWQTQGVGGVMKEQNEFALALNMVIPILIVLSGMEHRSWVRWGFRAAALSCAIAVVGTYSRSGVLGLALAVFLLTWYSNRKVLGFGAMGLGLVALLAFGPSKALDRYKTISTAFSGAVKQAATSKVSAEVDLSAQGRLEAWQTGLKMMKAHPFFGVGPMNFFGEFPRYSPQYHSRAPHNAFVALGAESGIPSALLFGAFVTLAIFDMWWTRRRIRGVPELSELAKYCLLLQMTFTVYLVPNQFINRQNQDLMYHLLGVSVGLSALVKAEVSARSAEPEMSYQPSLALEPGRA